MGALNPCPPFGCGKTKVAVVTKLLIARAPTPLVSAQVYLLSRGKVKPANKAYSTVRNDYSINFDEACTIEECADADASKMQARLALVPIDQLASFITKKVPCNTL